MTLLNPNLMRASEVVAREFDFPEGRVTLHFKTLSAMQYASLCNAMVSPDIGSRAESYAWAIKHSLCDEHGSQLDDNGEELVPLERVKQLKGKPFSQLLNAVMEINGVAVEKE